MYLYTYTLYLRREMSVARGKPALRLSRHRFEKWENYAPISERQRRRSIPDWPGGLLERS